MRVKVSVFKTPQGIAQSEESVRHSLPDASAQRTPVAVIRDFNGNKLEISVPATTYRCGLVGVYVFAVGLRILSLETGSTSMDVPERMTEQVNNGGAQLKAKASLALRDVVKMQGDVTYIVVTPILDSEGADNISNIALHLYNITNSQAGLRIELCATII